jgi:hypothetical protein
MEVGAIHELPLPPLRVLFAIDLKIDREACHRQYLDRIRTRSSVNIDRSYHHAIAWHT